MTLSLFKARLESNLIIRGELEWCISKDIYQTSVAKAMKVLRKLGCCLQIEVGIV